MGIIEKNGVMCGSLPTGQKVCKAKIKGICNKAVLSGHTLVVP